MQTLLETNLGRLQVELYKEIKKNGSSRCLRAALWRFADMCHLIRPQKCRPYVVNILPCIARICPRPEDAIQETLASAMQKMNPVLMGFTNDAEIKVSENSAPGNGTKLILESNKIQSSIFHSYLVHLGAMTTEKNSKYKKGLFYHNCVRELLLRNEMPLMFYLMMCI